jgi:GDPmannose 4,6-dehydratase
MTNKVALITGVTGQDGAYLSEFLLKKGYIVHGIKRRSSLFNTDRIDHIYQDPHVENKNFILHYGDLTDSTNLIRIIQEVQPDEIYNLGAMSHVQVSFEIPEYVADTDGTGTLRLLEAIRILGLTKKTRIYQASTSELYGKVQEIPQSEKTPFYPRSPYAVAKMYAFWITVNYREAYDMFACNGILFNHETISEWMPMIFKIGENGFVDIKPISEIVTHHTNKDSVSIDMTRQEYQETEVTNNLFVWDAKGWTKVLYASGYPHEKVLNNKNPRFLVSKNAAYLATGSHVCIMENEAEKAFKDIKIGDKVNIIEYPSVKTEDFDITEAEAELIGFIVGDGSIKEGRQIQITGKDRVALEYYASIWEALLPNNTTHYWQTKSGFNTENLIWQARLNNASSFIKKYRFYDSNHKKCVPFQILNADKNIQKSFLQGYNAADGMQSNPCKYEFKNFKTNSPTLASGLIFLLKNVTDQDYNINIETTEKWGKFSIYYSINILSDSELGQNHRNSTDNKDKVLELIEQGVSQRGIQRETGISRTFIRKVQNGYDAPTHHHLTKENNEIKKIIEMPHYEGWFFDLTTETGTFHCGIGQGHVHNSPLRGETFVTRKITRGVAKIALGLQDKLWMGNINSKRDWGHAKDYVEGMYLILQQEEPEDFVLATGVTTEIREFIRMAFLEVGFVIDFKGEGVDEKGYVAACNNPAYQLPIGKEVLAIDPKYFRPTEVDLLIGDPTKANTKLGWKPKYTVQTLCAEMVAADLELFKREQLLKDAGFEIKNQFE